jgi:peroxiredoxin
MTTPIADRVREMRAEREARGEAENPFTREQDELARLDKPDGLVRIGSPLPDATLLDVHGATTTLHTELAGGPTVIVLYRGAWCPYCNLTLNTYQRELLPELSTAGVQLIAISPQQPDGSLSMKEKHALEFNVLSDPRNQMARALGVLTRPSREVVEAQLQYGIDLTQVNADSTTELPMPTVAVVDQAGALVWLDIHVDYTSRSEPAAIIEAVGRAL